MSILRIGTFRKALKDPQDSCGREITTSRIRRSKHVWWASGPALEKFEHDIESEIHRALKNTCLTHADVYVRLYMIGTRQATARPIIMVCCTDSSGRDEAESLIRRSGILEKYPEFGIGASALPLEQPLPARLLADPDREDGAAFLRDSSLGDDMQGTKLLQGDPASAFAFQPQLHRESVVIMSDCRLPRIGRRLLAMTEADTRRRSATGGVVVRVQNRFYQLTAGHVVEPADDLAIPDLEECRFDGQSDDDTDIDHGTDIDAAHNATSRGSVSSDIAADTSVSGSEEDNESWETSSSTSSHLDGHREDTAEGKSPGITELTTSQGGIQHVSEGLDGELLQVGFIQYHSREEGNHHLDYALIEVNGVHDSHHVNVINLGDKFGTFSVDGISAISDVERKIMAITASRGCIRGVILPGVTYLRQANSSAVQKLYAIQLNGLISEGDSGAIVVDEISGHMYGHVVRGCSNTHTAYIVAATDVFADVEARFGDVSLATVTHMASSTTQPDIPNATTTNEDLDVEGKNEGSGRSREVSSHNTSAALHHRAGRHLDGDIEIAGWESDPASGMTAFLIQFQRGKPVRKGTCHPFRGKFPNQRATVSELLEFDPSISPLRRESVPDGRIRYFQLPENKAFWIENAIAQYFGEKAASKNIALSTNVPTPSQLILRPQLWNSHRRDDRDGASYAARLRPLCEAVSSDNKKEGRIPNNIVLFMPFLHWESDRKKRNAADVDDVEKSSKDRPWLENEEPIRVPHKGTLLNPDTRQRGDELVGNLTLPSRQWPLGIAMSRKGIDGHRHKQYLDASVSSGVHALEVSPSKTRGFLSLPDHSKISNQETITASKGLGTVKVDQLWMWILDGRTVISSFPRRSTNAHGGDNSGQKSIRRRLDAEEHTIRSSFDLALVILQQCSTSFSDPKKSQDRQHQLLDVFAEAVGAIVHEWQGLFERFRSSVSELSKPSRSYKDVPEDQFERLTKEATFIHKELLLMDEIKDLELQLEVFLRVTMDQKEAITKFKKHAESILDADGKLGNPTRKGSAANREDGSADTEHDKFFCFQYSAESLISTIDEKLEELKALKNSAELTSRSLNDLLTLKRQQAGIIQAREAVRQADESLKQGRSIMIFTVMTIFFLPLSFASSLFGMNYAPMLDDVQGQSWSLWITLGFTLCSVGALLLPLVFNQRMLEIVSAMFKLAFNWLFIRTGLYSIWMALDKDSGDLIAMVDETIQKMKSEVMRDQNEAKTGLIEEIPKRRDDEGYFSNSSFH